MEYTSQLTHYGGILHHTTTSWKKCETIDSNNHCLLDRGRKKFRCKNMKDGEAQQSLDFYDQYLDIIGDNTWSFEAFVVDRADEIVQRHHDIEDGIISNIFEPEEFMDAFEDIFSNTIYYRTTKKESIFKKIRDEITSGAEEEYLLHKRIINSQKAQLMDGKGTFIIRNLFEAYLSTPNQLPDEIVKKVFADCGEIKIGEKITRYRVGELRGEFGKRMTNDTVFLSHLCRNICDYIANMTDRYALKQYERLYESAILS